MARVHSLLLPVLAVLSAANPHPSEAKSKAYCREWASDVADHRVNAGDVVAGAVIGAAGGALLGAAINGPEGAGKGAIIGGAGGAMLTGATLNDRWEAIYRRAYAQCRAS